MPQFELINKRLSKLVDADFEDIAGLGLDPIGKRQSRRPEEMHVHITGTQELRVLKVMKLEIFDGVTHVVLARQELFFPNNALTPANAADPFKMTG